MIRGFTLWRPWGWCFTDAGKRVENRTWKPPPKLIGGMLALHSGQRFDAEAFAKMRAGAFGDAAKAVPDEKDHPAGFIVAVALLTGSSTFAEVPELPDLPYAFGPECWHTPIVHTLEEPVPHMGSQGLWKLTASAERRVLAQLPPEGLTPKHGGDFAGSKTVRNAKWQGWGN